MSILIIGGDKVERLEKLLKTLGATKTVHWDSRSKTVTKKHIPIDTDGIIMLIDFLRHNSMSYFKGAAKKEDIPVMYVRRGTRNVATKFVKMTEVSHERWKDKFLKEDKYV